MHLAPQPSLAHLGALVEKVRAAGLPLELRVQGEEVPHVPGIDLSAYRILQEALTDALKHVGGGECVECLELGRRPVAERLV